MAGFVYRTGLLVVIQTRWVRFPYLALQTKEKHGSKKESTCNAIARSRHDDLLSMRIGMGATRHETYDGGLHPSSQG